MTEARFDTYDFLINDEDEAMLLLYAHDDAPQNPRIELDIEAKEAVLWRSDKDCVELKDIPEEVLDSLQDADKLLVCELSMDNDEKETRIIHAYEAEIAD